METETVLIHVRFASDGSVLEISERPAPLSPQEWFNRLSDASFDEYQALSGGRGLFRFPKEKLETVRAQVVSSAAA
jgi:hypothetical protein